MANGRDGPLRPVVIANSRIKSVRADPRLFNAIKTKGRFGHTSTVRICDKDP